VRPTTLPRQLLQPVPSATDVQTAEGTTLVMRRLAVAPSVGPSPALRTLRPNKHISFVHVVRQGDTLAGLATRYGVTASRIARTNGIALQDELTAGQRLVIPPVVSIIFDGTEVPFDVAPQFVKGHLVAPIRHMFEHVGATVYWRPRSKQVEVVVADKTVTVQVGSAKATVDERVVLLDVAAFLRDDRVMVPVRFVGEVLDVTMRYDKETGNIVIVSNDKTSAPAL